MRVKNVIMKLLESREPAVKLKTYLRLLDYDYDSSTIKKLVKNIKKDSPLISSLFSFLPKDEKSYEFHAYNKWYGIHWVLASLADIGYPLSDGDLIPSRNLELNWLLSDEHWSKRKTIAGRKRFCASIEGNALYSILSLGLDDGRCSKLADRLVKYQWDDGGWNCDKHPEAINSSYHESLIPMRALNVYARITNNKASRIAVNRAAELFLKRKLFRSLKNNEIIHNKWIKLHYPPFWHYDTLMALKILAEADKIRDSRCNEALNILESKQLSDGGFPAEAKYYQSANTRKSHYSPANWGGTSKIKMNEWVTIDALYVLKLAKRYDVEVNC